MYVYKLPCYYVAGQKRGCYETSDVNQSCVWSYRVMRDCRHLLWDTDSPSCVASSLRCFRGVLENPAANRCDGYQVLFGSDLEEHFAYSSTYYPIPYVLNGDLSMCCVLSCELLEGKHHTVHSSFWIKMNSEEYSSWWACLLLVSHQCDECAYG